MQNQIAIPVVDGLKKSDQAILAELITLYNYHIAKNAEKDRYYEGNIPLSEVNLGIALPDGLNKLEIGCAWGAKCVDVLASRSMFDGFVGRNGTEAKMMSKIVRGNRLISEYPKACRDELNYGCDFATLSKDPDIGCKIRFHSPKTASAVWSGEKGRIKYGFAIIDVFENEQTKRWEPCLMNLYLDTTTVVIKRASVDSQWIAEYHPHKLGRPLMEPLVWNGTSKKPFGRSRNKAPIRRLIQGYVRTIANATIGLEFSTTPQKYLLGVTDEQYDAVINQKFKQYIGSIIAATQNPDTGQNPNFGQLAQGSLEPHVQMLRMLATQFSAATGLTVTDTGVVNDANPTSSDAILAQSQTLILMAEQLNSSNGDALNTIAQMALAIAGDKSLADLDDEERDVIAHFKNPAMPSVAVTADAAVKIASSRPEFASTDTYLEMIGFDQADIRRIKEQESRIRGQKVLIEEIKDKGVGNEG